MWRWQTIVIAMLMATAGLVTDVLRADDASAADVASFLTLREIDRSARSAIEAATEWNDAADAVVVKVLERLAAPAGLVSAWREAASRVPAAGEPVAVADELLGIRGRAIFVAPR